MPALSRTTRGRSRPGRLRLVDRYLLAAEAALLGAPGDAPVVDLGLGAEPWTTVALFEALAALPAPPPVLGVDVDPARVAGAQAAARPGLSFVVSGFDVPGPARLVRAMNVLRQYPPAQVAEARARMGAALVEGGLLVEGTSNKEGHIVTAALLRRRGAALVAEGLLLATDFSAGFAPAMFARWLPRDLRPAGRPSPAAQRLLDGWTAAFAGTTGALAGRFADSAAAAGLRGVGDGMAVAGWPPQSPSPNATSASSMS
ncbi:MAG: methylase [Alphaproteobacteria bacterium]|nr:methylase [Alphaproteobacteria bacterium]